LSGRSLGNDIGVEMNNEDIRFVMDFFILMGYVVTFTIVISWIFINGPCKKCDLRRILRKWKKKTRRR